MHFMCIEMMDIIQRMKLFIIKNYKEIKAKKLGQRIQRKNWQKCRFIAKQIVMRKKQSPRKVIISKLTY